MTVYQGEWQDATIASGGTSTDEINLAMRCDFMEVQIPTLTSCTIKVQTAEDKGGTYRDLGDGVTTRTTTGNFHAKCPLGTGGWQWVKIVVSAAQASAVTFRVQGGRS